MKYYKFYHDPNNFIRSKTLKEISQKLSNQSKCYMQYATTPPFGATTLQINNARVLAEEYKILAERIHINSLMEESSELDFYFAKIKTSDFELYIEMLKRKNDIEDYFRHSNVKAL